MFENNPIPIITKHTDTRIDSRENPDPYMISHGGKYYCYSTGYQGVNVLQSDNLESFEHMGFALSYENEVAYWAPAVLYYQRLFYMYYSSLKKGEPDVHQQAIKVAVADNPLGPFEYKKTLYEPFSIDPHVIEKNGELYMFYSANITHGEKIGTVILADKMQDPYTPCNNSRVIISPSIEQEIFAKNRFGDGRDWYTIEGAFYFEQGSTGYLMYSANAWTHGDYFVGYATCDASVPLYKAIFEKYPNADEYRPLLGKDEHFTGCGHNSVIADAAGRLYIVYHGRSVDAKIDEVASNGRQLCISGLTIKGAELKLVRREVYPQ